ncbi:hypothetical protein LCGC14_1162230 [marine sediment metagenome]|uniref:Glycoside hydrolase family 5 domain-containing protein n=1 Tax=marine sediment metagenome TaxID=412755 RepID=A0A0F9LS64_9ZZZZ
MSKYFPKIPKAFGCNWYHNKYSDVKSNEYYGKYPERAWDHFVNHGLGEGRKYAPDTTVPPSPPPPPEPPDPKPDSPYFDFYGQQKFLVFVSYFDGIRAKHLESDLDYLKSKGIDGIRLYLNFSYPPNRPWDFLFRPDGSLHPHKLGMLGYILRLARDRNMIVDISSSRRLDPDGWQMSFGTYAHAWRLLTLELQKWTFGNYIIDIENEHNCPWAGQKRTMTPEEAFKTRSAIRNSLPTVPITASVACNISPEAAASIAMAEGMTCVGYHNPRVQGWAEATEELALRCKRWIGDNSIKVYDQEPPRIGAGVSSTQELRVALAGARRAKIAGWCFHTDAGFKLSDGSFESKLKPVGREFLNGLD